LLVILPVAELSQLVEQSPQSLMLVLTGKFTLLPPLALFPLQTSATALELNT
jgi:hypothetical protein